MAVDIQHDDTGQALEMEAYSFWSHSVAACAEATAAAIKSDTQAIEGTSLLHVVPSSFLPVEGALVYCMRDG